MGPAQRRLGRIACALSPLSPRSCSSATRPPEPKWDTESPADGPGDEAEDNRALSLEEHLFVFDLQGVSSSGPVPSPRNPV